MKRFGRMKGVWLIVMVVVLALSASVTIAVAADKTSQDLVDKAKKKVVEISVADAKKKVDSSSTPVFILDVREPEEFKAGHIPKAINIPRGMLEFQINQAIPDKKAQIIVYCKSGGRSALAAYTLKEMGYKNVESMAAGFPAWMKAGYPVE
jgi:rhodanese-related sulfurtransferase